MLHLDEAMLRLLLILMKKKENSKLFEEDILPGVMKEEALNPPINLWLQLEE
jgi:hypothetical protein